MRSNGCSWMAGSMVEKDIGDWLWDWKWEIVLGGGIRAVCSGGLFGLALGI